MIHKVTIKQKMINIKSTISEKKENINIMIYEIKRLSKDKKINGQEEDKKCRKLAPNLFA
jgi:sensor domain CHASE-containing protein